MGQSFVVASGKGGVGKTSVVAGVSSCLAKLGQETVCVDGDAGLRNLDLVLGLQERAVFDFTDVLAGRVPLDDALVAHPDIPGLSMLAAPIQTPDPPVDPVAFRALIETLAERAAFVLVDSPAGLGGGFALAAGACTGALVVTTPDQSALRDGARCAELLYDHSPAKLIVNRVQPRLIKLQHAHTIDQIMDAVGLPLLGVVPEDEMVLAAQNHNVPVVLAAGTGASVAFCNIADRLAGNPCPLPRRFREWKVVG
ncbi:MAG: septum site-determining protein MinD [Oscillospiraceae bacterium]|jgi:septum site-determining protein MinD|nr:septum site-determining protein MinD [Oscillospiraceae bacterium]